MKVVPIVVPMVLWNEYVAETQASLGRSPTRSLDEAALVVGDFRSFIMSLGHFQREETEPIPYLRSRENDPALDMLSFTFFVEAEPQMLLDVLKIGHINTFGTQDRDDVLLVSGTLRQWRLAIFESSISKQLNPILLEITKCLIRMGLRELIADCDFSATRKALPR